jgi:hypothetical protein
LHAFSEERKRQGFCESVSVISLRSIRTKKPNSSPFHFSNWNGGIGGFSFLIRVTLDIQNQTNQFEQQQQFQTTTATTTTTMSLYRDVLAQIFSYLDYHNWFNVMCTCKLWNEVGRRTFDPTKYHRDTLKFAISRNNVLCCKALLRDPRIDPSGGGNVAILLACSLGNVEIIKELLKDSRVDPQVPWEN